MNYKEIDAPDTTVTRNTNEIDSKTGNLYKAIVIASKRANQVSVSHSC